MPGCGSVCDVRTGAAAADEATSTRASAARMTGAYATPARACRPRSRSLRHAPMARSAKRAAADPEVEAFLADHARSCLHTVETWMLRSLPVPRGVVEAVLPDPAWAGVLRDAWVIAVGADGTVDPEAGGLLRGVDPKRGIGVVDRDGETSWLASAQLLVPHPVLLDEIDDLRDLAVQIGATQGLSQLFRETFARPSIAPDDPLAVATFAGGHFEMMQQATNLAKDLGYRVSGGAAVCRVLERGRWFEARF